MKKTAEKQTDDRRLLDEEDVKFLARVKKLRMEIKELLGDLPKLETVEQD